MPTDLDFENLGLDHHIALRVEKDKAIEVRLDSTDTEIVRRYNYLLEKHQLQETAIKELKQTFAEHNARLIAWGTAIIAVLFSGISYLITKHFSSKFWLQNICSHQY